MSSSGYYSWLRRGESQRLWSNRVLGVEIRSIFSETDGTYGAIRTHRELRKNGIICGKNRVARIMQAEKLVSIHKKKFKPCTTDSKHLLPVAPNVIEQDFTADQPNTKWGGDITYIPTQEGFLYLAIILDFFSRKVIGRAAGDHLRAELCCEALKMALLRRRSPKNIVHHSDRGAQYASDKYSLILKQNNFIQSMSRAGNCYDNAMVESFFHTLKVERVNRRNYRTKKEALDDVIDFIENFYNTKRSHSSLDYVSPDEYELLHKLAA